MMNDAPASTEMPPLMIIGHWPPILRRVTPTINWTSPATTAQTPHTRSTAGIPDAHAMATPIAVIRLTATFTYSRAGDPAARDARASTTAAATSNSG